MSIDRLSLRCMAAILLWLGAGTVAAKTDPDYERLRGSLDALKANAGLAAFAPAEIALADQALVALNMQGSGREHDHLVFLAERRIDLAQAAAQALEQESKLQQLEREHDRILLAASRRDAEQARLELEKQRLQSLAQAEESQRLRAEAEQARAQSEQTSQEAEAARKLAEAQAKEAALARKEAALLEASGVRKSDGKTNATKTALPPAVVLGEATFAPGQFALRPYADAQIARIAARAGSRFGLRIQAFANDATNAKANLALSAQRAHAVRAALIAAGVAADRIAAVGVGAAKNRSRETVVAFTIP